MSGFAAIVWLDGSMQDPALLASVRGTLRLRGSGGEARWSDAGVTLLHTRLAAGEKDVLPPLERDGHVVVFEGRLDGREDLLRSLRAMGREVVASIDDTELVGQCVAEWGTRAPENLIGDFSFAVWNRRTRELFCVRDRFGVRPMYYARAGAALVVSNDLTTLLAVEGLAGPLHAPALADFLLFSGNQDLSTTTYEAILRVPPAHAMVVGRGGETTLQRFWSLPASQSPRKISDADAVGEFRSMFQTAVSDRMRGEPVTISLSGGLDSAAVAAAAVRGQRSGIHAVTAGYERMFVDEEREYARQTATSLGMAWEFAPADHYSLFERWDDPRCRGLEPSDTPMRAAFVDLMGRLAVHGRLLLTGQGGDSVLYTSHRHFLGMLRRGRILPAVSEMLWYAISRHRRPPLLLRSHALRALGLRSDQPAFPSWIREDFARAHDLRARWADFWGWRKRALHPWRPEAALFTMQPMWPGAFESYDFAWTGAHLELTVPFLDTRLVEFLFTLPAMPHFADKDILRQAMKGWLPERVRNRAKTPLAADPAQILFLQADARQWSSHFSLIEAYVDPRILRSMIEGKLQRGQRIDREIPAVCLAEWLSFR